MGNSRRTSDRADFLRQLLQAASRWEAEILLRPVQHGIARQGSEAPSDDRGENRNPCVGLDLTARCEQCGAALSPDASARRKFCNRRCQSAYFNGLTSAALMESKQGRTCAICSGPIPLTRRADARFCGQKCLKSMSNPGRRKKVTKTCPHCENQFRPIRIEQVHCSRHCEDAAKRAAQMRACEWCGSVFRAKHHRTRFCCLSCASRANWTGGRTRVLPWCGPPRLTAARFDARWG